MDDAELKVMNNTNTLDGRDAGLIHLHTCIHCGHARRREEINVAEIRSGIFACPDCGRDGRLNIEIRNLPAAAVLSSTECSLRVCWRRPAAQKVTA
jgi:hypothetical protein